MTETYLSTLLRRNKPTPALASPTDGTRGNETGTRNRTRVPRDPYLDFALRWWVLLLVGVVLGVAAGFAYLKYGPISYASTAYVQVNPPVGLSSQDSAKQFVTDLTAEAGSPYLHVLVAQALAKSLRVSPADLDRMTQNGQLDVRQVSAANFIRIDATIENPDSARLIANTYASVFVDDVAGRNRAELDARQNELQQQINETKNNLAMAQLQQREQDLNRQLREQRGQLLQIQGNYLQMLQGQLVAERLAPGSANQSAIDPEAARQAEQLQSQMYDNLKADVQLVQSRLMEVNGELAQMPNSGSVAADQQQLSSLLAQQAGAASSLPPAQVTDGINRTRAQLAAARVFKQTLDLQSQIHDLQLQLVDTAPGQAPQLQARLADAQNQLAAALGSYNASGWTFDAATLDITLANLQDRLAALLGQAGRPSVGPSAQSLTQQIASVQGRLVLQGKAAQLADEKRSLESKLVSENGQIFQMDQQRIQKLANTPAKPIPLDPTSQQAVQQLGSLSSQVQSQWQQEAVTQQQDIEHNIADLTSQVDQVHAALAQLPAGTDLTLIASLADAYSAQLRSLTDEYVKVHDSRSAPAPVSRLGLASDPIATIGVKKILAFGLAGGLILAVALAYLIDQVRPRRPMADALFEHVLMPIPASGRIAASNGLLAGPKAQLPRIKRSRRRSLDAPITGDANGG